MSNGLAPGGVVPILVTPFSPRGDLDLPSLERQVRFLVRAGIDWVGFGFASEVTRLTDAENDELLAETTRLAPEGLSVVAHVREISTRAAARRAENAAARGAAALMVTAPSPRTPTKQLVRHFRALADATELPLVLQDAPAMTGVELPAMTLAELVREIEHITALKIEGDASAEKIATTHALLDRQVTLFGGSGGVDLFRELDAGATATMPGPSFADRFVLIARRYLEGDHQTARELHAELLPLLVLAQKDFDTFVWIEKELLRRRGVLSSAALRAPHSRPSRQLKTDLDAEWSLIRLDQPLVVSARG